MTQLRRVSPCLLERHLRVLILDHLPRRGHVRAVKHWDGGIGLLLRHSSPDAVPSESSRDPIDQPPRLRFDQGGLVRADASAPLFVAEILGPVARHCKQRLSTAGGFSRMALLRNPGAIVSAE